MDIFQSFILGLVQGLTEFLPISSSAHLVLIPHFLGWQSAPVFFDIMLHLGTLIAVLFFFYKDILRLFTTERRLIILIIIACIPAFLVGVLFKDIIEKLFENPIGVSVLLLVTGVFLYAAPSTIQGQNTKNKAISFFDALLIGIAQAFAIAPGISRSGATITTALFRGVSAEESARFSFLLSIPVILGAFVFKFKDIGFKIQGLLSAPYVVGMIAAAISGFFAIKFVFKAIKAGKFKMFAYYCWAIGIFSLLFIFIRK